MSPRKFVKKSDIRPGTGRISEITSVFRAGSSPIVSQAPSEARGLGWWVQARMEGPRTTPIESGSSLRSALKIAPHPRPLSHRERGGPDEIGAGVREAYEVFSSAGGAPPGHDNSESFMLVATPVTASRKPVTLPVAPPVASEAVSRLEPTILRVFRGSDWGYPFARGCVDSPTSRSYAGPGLKTRRNLIPLSPPLRMGS